MTVGQRIESERKRNNLTMEELGNRLGVGRSAVNKWEKGVVSGIKREYISEMAKIFGCDPAWLGGFKDEVESFDTPAQFEQYWSEHGGGQHPIPISEEEYNLIQEYRTAPEEDRQHARRILSYAKLLKERIGEQSEEIPYLKESPKPFMAASDIPALNNAFAAHKITKKSEKIIKARNKEA